MAKNSGEVKSTSGHTTPAHPSKGRLLSKLNRRIQMNTKKYISFFAAITLTLSLLMPFAYAGQASKGEKKAAGKKEFTFHGKVEQIDPKTKKLTINGEN